MLIAVSINKPELISDLSDSFGRSKYFMIYNLANNESEFLLNPYSKEFGGAGIQSAQYLIEKKIEALITPHIGIHPLSFFNSLNIKVYYFEQGSAVEAIELFKEKKLDEISISESDYYQKRVRKRFRSTFSNNTTNHNNK
jgi:predicted Fe-Mo cluster-binding NifX family protein